VSIILLEQSSGANAGYTRVYGSLADYNSITTVIYCARSQDAIPPQDHVSPRSSRDLPFAAVTDPEALANPSPTAISNLIATMHRRIDPQYETKSGLLTQQD